MIHISENLKKILNEIKSSSRIAFSLLENSEELHEKHPDYLDISGSDSTKISYLTQDRLASGDTTRDVWTCNKRFHGRPGSVINKIFKNLTGPEVEMFNNLYKSALNRIQFKFEIVKHEDIRSAYHYTSNSREAGSLGVSCMKYDSCQRFFDLYVENSDVINLLIMTNDDGKLMGRALLWNFDSNKVMDRIYTVNDDELSYHFKKWAVDNGYIYKHEQKWNNSLAFEANGKKIEQKLSVRLKNWKFDRYPYMDTFKFLDRIGGVVYNYNPLDSTPRDIKTLCAPDGRYFDSDHLELDYFTNLHHHRGEMVTIQYLDGKMITNSADFVRSYQANTEWSGINNMYILRRDSEYNDVIDEHIFKMELDHLNDKPRIDARIKEREDYINSRVRKSNPFESLYTDGLRWMDPGVTRGMPTRRYEYEVQHDVAEGFDDRPDVVGEPAHATGAIFDGDLNFQNPVVEGSSSRPEENQASEDYRPVEQMENWVRRIYGDRLDDHIYTYTRRR